jgi:cytoskeletal protein CcmA (bactofilin family)
VFKKVIGQDLGASNSPSTPPVSPSGPTSAPAPAASSYSVPTPPSSAPAQAAASRPPQGSTRNVLSSDVEIKGTVKFTNDLVVDGKIEGEINSDGNLTVGENARIRAEIKTGTVVIYGKVHGNITVSERVELKASAEVVGDIKAKTLSIEAGAIFVGKSTVGTPAQGAPASKAAEPKQGDLAGTHA